MYSIISEVKSFEFSDVILSFTFRRLHIPFNYCRLCLAEEIKVTGESGEGLDAWSFLEKPRLLKNISMEGRIPGMTEVITRESLQHWQLYCLPA